jgi:signal transduction histidine kinase
MAHEFRTPVAILRSTHEALTKFDGLEDLEKTQRYLHANESVLRKMEGDLERILAIAPFENGGPRIKDEIIAIDALMHELLTPYRVLETADFTIENQLRDNAIHSDRYLLGSVLTNLIDNAIKYGGERIVITFSVANDENYWHIAISDNGKGIMPQHLPHIFDKFYRAPQDDRHDTKGFGLGLSYVQQLTQALGGSINVKSRPGEGTTFTLTFPWKK